MKKINIEYVQLHGEETKEICKELKTLFPQIKIIKVIKINPKDVSSDISAAQENLKNQEFIATTINQINDFLSYVDYFLFDTKVDTETGGTGKNFDWEIVLEIKKHFENLNTKLQFFVAGGLNPENVTSVVELLEPYGVDVASGVERLPRRKDFEKMKSFIRNAKRS
jgi:phosphoribosylanthranilate isomerase